MVFLSMYFIPLSKRRITVSGRPSVRGRNCVLFRGVYICSLRCYFAEGVGTVAERSGAEVAEGET